MNDIEDDGPVCEMQSEEKIREKIDDDGTKWRKVYMGSGEHFNNWLSQVIELNGEDNVKVEEVAPKGLRCYEDSGIKAYRIWIKDTA